MSERATRPKAVRPAAPPPTDIGRVCAALGLALEDVERWAMDGTTYVVVEKGGRERRLTPEDLEQQKEE